MTKTRWRSRRLACQRGAVLIQVTVALLALLALSAFVFDYGVMWASRGQAQNSADAGALAGAIALAFDGVEPLADAKTDAVAKAKAIALRNNVWGSAPDVTDADVTFPECPIGAPGLPDTCVKVDVFRTGHAAYARANPKPLPTFFARLAGVLEQGVTATATAQVFAGTSARCVKPWAVPDKWMERYPDEVPWTMDSEFDIEGKGKDKGPLANPDVYIPPGQPGHTGFTVENDLGTEMTLKVGHPKNAIQPGWFFPVVIDPGNVGGRRYRDAIEGCATPVIGPGTILQTEPGNMIGPTNHGMDYLIDLDEDGEWDPVAKKPTGGCMEAGTCGTSPRLIALAVFDVDHFTRFGGGGRTEVRVVKILGFWLDRMQGNDVVGYLTHYPTIAAGTPTVDEDSTFLRTVILVR